MESKERSAVWSHFDKIQSHASKAKNFSKANFVEDRHYVELQRSASDSDMRSNSASIRDFFTVEKIYRIIALRSESDRIGKLLLSGRISIRIRILSHP